MFIWRVHVPVFTVKFRQSSNKIRQVSRRLHVLLHNKRLYLQFLFILIIYRWKKNEGGQVTISVNFPVKIFKFS